MTVDEIRQTLQEHRTALQAEGVRSLAVFGSTVRGEDGADSDIDLLAEFDPAARIGLIRLITLEDRLGHLLGRKVDLIARDALDRLVQDRVNAEARDIL